MPDETDFNPQARIRLIAIVRAGGSVAMNDPSSLAEQIRVAGAYGSEYLLLAKAVDYRIAQDVAGAPPGPVDRLVEFLAHRFSEDADIPLSQAKWAVDSWAMALGKMPAPQDPSRDSFGYYSSQPPLAGPPPYQPTWQQTPTGWQQPGPPGGWGVQPYGQAQQYYGDENTSGTIGPIPLRAETQRWSWGAFGLHWIWLMAHNRVGWGLLFILASILGACVCCGLPIVPLAAMIALGITGNRIAWQYRRFDSIEHFKTVEGIWSAWGLAMVILYPVVYVASIVLDIALKATGHPFHPLHPHW